MDAASVIIRELDAASPRCSGDAREDAERQLVALVPEFTVEELRVLARLVRDRLDQDGAEPRDELRSARRSLTVTTTRDGMVQIEWLLPPESGGLVKAGIDALVGVELRASHEGREACDFVEERSLPQLRSDAAVEIFRHVATCSTWVGRDDYFPGHSGSRSANGTAAVPSAAVRALPPTPRPTTSAGGRNGGRAISPTEFFSVCIITIRFTILAGESSFGTACPTSSRRQTSIRGAGHGTGAECVSLRNSSAPIGMPRRMNVT